MIIVVMSVLAIAGFIAVITFVFAAVRKREKRPTIEMASMEVNKNGIIKCPDCGSEQVGEPKFCNKCGHTFNNS